MEPSNSSTSSDIQIQQIADFVKDNLAKKLFQVKNTQNSDTNIQQYAKQSPSKFFSLTEDQINELKIDLEETILNFYDKIQNPEDNEETKKNEDSQGKTFIIEDSLFELRNSLNQTRYTTIKSKDRITNDRMYELQLITSYKDMSFLKKLDLIISINDEGIENYEKFFKSLKSLKSLALSFQTYNDLSNESFQECILALLPISSSLEELSILCPYQSLIIDNENLNSLGSVIKMCDKLQSFTLDISKCNEVTQNGMIELDQSISQVKTLKHLSVIFEYLPCNIVPFGYQISKKLDLTTFKINLNYSSSLQTDFEQVASVIKNSTEVVEIVGDDFNDIMISNLSKRLNMAQNIKQFTLSVQESQKLYSLDCLLDGLFKQEKIQKIKLGTKGTMLSNSIMRAFQAKPNSKLTKLTEIDIQLQESTVYPEHLDQYAELISVCGNLVNVKFSFNCTGYTKNIKKIVESLAINKKIKNLDLNFRYCCQLSNEDFVNLWNCISQLPVLNKLKLNLDVNMAINKEGIIEASEYVKKCDSINEMDLSMGACKYFSTESIENSFIPAIQEMSSLRNLKLSMINSHVKIEKSKLNNYFKKIKNVKIEGL